MKKLSVFNFVSADGYFAGPKGEIDWFKEIKKDPDYDAYTHSQSQGSSTLIFGHTTYEMMKSYWPTPEAIKNDPHMAEVMNNSPKIVFSKTLTDADIQEGPNWKNIRLMNDIKPEAIKKLKEWEDITILGSGSVVQQLANLGLIDEYNLMVVPIILGAGKSLFQDVKQTNLDLLEAKPFKNGVVSLRYQAVQ